MPIIGKHRMETRESMRLPFAGCSSTGSSGGLDATRFLEHLILRGLRCVKSESETQAEFGWRQGPAQGVKRTRRSQIRPGDGIGKSLANDLKRIRGCVPHQLQSVAG
jgi:hypothetical protein